MTDYFNEKTILFSVGIVFILLSIFFHVFHKEKYALIFLLCSATALFLFASVLYPFLNVWDERFHALVAKNLMKHPLMPTLYDDPIVNMPYDRWDMYHIWLHKQPLFLWQIAFSFKILGINEFALRLPSVILSCLFVWAGYRTGMLLGNKKTGYYTAFLIVTSYYLSELISGKQELEHNDIAFLTYTSLSLWVWVEYIFSKKKYWIVLIGIFSGFAILCKWMVGLLVYLCWGIYSIREKKWQIKKYSDILLSLIITAVIVLPWQLLIFHWYPAEAKVSYEYNTKHFFEAIEGHSGIFSYHFLMMSDIYGSLALYLIVPALIIFYLKTTNKNVAFALIAAIVFVYLFFSLAETKMPSFTTVLALPMYISLAFLIVFLIEYFEKLKLPPLINKVVVFVFISVIAIKRIDVNAINNRNLLLKDKNSCFGMLKHNKQIFQNLHLPSNAVIFNVHRRHYIEAMFYTGLPAYNFTPTNKQYADLKKKNRIIALFYPINDTIPHYIKKDSTSIIIQDTLKLCE